MYLWRFKCFTLCLFIIVICAALSPLSLHYLFPSSSSFLIIHEMSCAMGCVGVGCWIPNPLEFYLSWLPPFPPFNCHTSCSHFTSSLVLLLLSLLLSLSPSRCD
ncbi:hypothetical protein, unlikely [Trypanosoma brucei gambiense DAL972]|uniref:Uncharacterized protein n=1 Tax=Trypanosoma brucei gambiense (strain MHOM/CI/86/DAL972) TaxID=679716 RepID=C9ZSG8_TRYB9|nr:hypothetical protein, unlikely [Trypanosoma brucei gambiense DAL972]CBH12352.1 hypothetical protein, unlikely [Trypanosoma brucei gambiense DAL972]|eukprot:XP_011774633.1 hypothetical protein, unlikely [Trypanosoma brucei gambiense DAL972]